MGIQERKEREKTQRRDDILNAAQEVFFEKGLQNATMDEIAEKAELSKGTIYLYYRSKEDLYLAVMMRGMELLYTMFAQATGKQRSAVEALRALADVYTQFFHEHRSLFRMLHFSQTPQLHKQVSEEMRTACSIQNMKIWNFVQELIARGIEEGDIRRDLNPIAVAVLLWSATTSIMSRIDYGAEYWKSTMNVDLNTVLRQSLEFLLDALMTPHAREQLRQQPSIS